MSITITYTLRKVEPEDSPTGTVKAEKVEETLSSLKAAEARAKDVLQLDEIFGAVQFWDEEGDHAGSME